MLFQKINRSDADKVFIICKNGEAFQMLGGTPVNFDYTTDSNGNTVILPTTAYFRFFAGCVADGEVMGTSGQPDQYGKVQVYGHHPGVYMLGTTIAAGNILQQVTGKSYFSLGVTNAWTMTAEPQVGLDFVTAGQAACLLATSTFGNTYKAFIRAM